MMGLQFAPCLESKNSDAHYENGEEEIVPRVEIDRATRYVEVYER